MPGPSTTAERSARGTRAKFLGFIEGLEGDPIAVVFYAPSHSAFHDLYAEPMLKRELVVVLSNNPLLTTGDLHGTFPAARERSADRQARAEFAYTNAVQFSSDGGYA